MLTSDHLTAISSPAELSRVQSWVDDLAFILSSKPQKPAVALIAARRGCSTSLIHQKLRALREKGPLSLLDGRTRRHQIIPALGGHRSPAFIAWVHSLYYQVQRTHATPTVYGLMIARLRAWRQDPANPALAIPGYDTPPLDCPRSGYEHPYGWSQRQLNAIKPDDYNLALGRKGRHAANLLLPPVLTTRVGLHPGEVYLFDDQYYDLMVHYGHKLVRPVGLNGLDLFSGCDVIRGIRPELPDNPEGERSLTRDDLTWLIVSLLTQHGYYKDRCVITVESGSATVPEEFAKTLALVSDQKISVSIGFPGREVVKGVLTPSRGNPRFKAARESWFNLLRNRMAALPVALGRNYEDKPEDTDRIAEEDRHLLALHHQHPGLLDDLQLESLPWSRFFPLANYISEAINNRRDHDLEGYATLGLESVQWRYRDEWITEDEYRNLPGHARGAIVDRMHAGEIVTRVVKNSPREVYDAGRNDLKKISPYRWHLLIPHSLAIPRTVPDNRQIVIKSKAYGPEPIVLQSIYYPEGDQDGRPLPVGKDVLIFLPPHSPDTALLTDPHGRVLGLCFALQRSHRLDQDALLDQYAQRATLKARIGTSAETYNAQVGADRQARRDQNRALIQAQGLKPPKTAAERLKKRPSKPLRKPSQATIEVLPPEEILPTPKPLTLPPAAMGDDLDIL
jgi:hypothetical protein